MICRGLQLIGNSHEAGGGPDWHGHAAATGQALEPAYRDATAEQIGRVLGLAAAAHRVPVPSEVRANLLDGLASAIETLGASLLDRCAIETGLPLGRLTGERSRTCAQLRMFAALVREGSWVEARIDRPTAERAADLRRMLIPLGPVVVFAAGNFPLAFSVAGGDAASAIAAGCPIVVKAHPSHPGTSELVGEAMLEVGRALGMSEGWFSLLHGRDHAVGRALAVEPRTRAVAFTGSLRGGRALMDAAATRPDPIPVFAEMGSINPVFLLPHALERRAESLADAAAVSITAGVGQFCTKPGVLFVPFGAAGDRFVARLSESLAAFEPGVMLDERLLASYRAQLTERSNRLGRDVALGTDARAPARLLECEFDRFAHEPELRTELFGPASLVVRYRDAAQLFDGCELLDGQLAAALHADPEDQPLSAELLDRLRDRAGRVLFGGWPTGVEPCSAMQHGGPWPASSDARSTSVGTTAIARFARPLCLQNVPAELLPAELRDDNPRRLLRWIDGVPTRE